MDEIWNVIMEYISNMSFEFNFNPTFFFLSPKKEMKEDEDKVDEGKE